MSDNNIPVWHNTILKLNGEEVVLIDDHKHISMNNNKHPNISDINFDPEKAKQLSEVLPTVSRQLRREADRVKGKVKKTLGQAANNMCRRFRPNINDTFDTSLAKTTAIEGTDNYILSYGGAEIGTLNFEIRGRQAGYVFYERKI